MRLDTAAHVVDLSREGFDVGIRSGAGDWPGVEAVKVMPSVFTALCSPVFAEMHGIRTAQDLLKAPRIGLDKEWAVWFAACGLAADGQAPARLRADYQALEVASALGGQGAALASPILFAREIAAGLLIQPVPCAVELIPDYAYWLVWPEGRRRSTKIARFRDWILAEAEADPTIAAAIP